MFPLSSNALRGTLVSQLVPWRKITNIIFSDGRLTFLTTNYPERLDPALIRLLHLVAASIVVIAALTRQLLSMIITRPGRIDLKEKIGWATHPQVS